ncbi:SOUL family heme-binding protein [Halococcus saccharolyticus]|uniref:SOUL heme-binding protein n=1 Tax=Halococcus saccharolyticus DSM 5350 TaxID=1227455 RepID=M0MJ48_9EURY|nr:heme-binding protein [Halococcus saccharolyticus]EMA45378.1 SOUL heme-binding protein [Halococcus saccharolyticus DSM 5350]
MNRTRLEVASAAAVGGAVALWSGYSVLTSRSAERVEYIVERTIDDRTEIRRYPELVRVETTGSSNREAFERLFEYLQGANESRSAVAMTAPVRTDENADGEPIEMTSPVRTDVNRTDEGESVSMTSPVRIEDGDDGVRMGFYLPAEYTPNTAPRPTDSAVSLAIEEPRSVAARRFSWWATDWRTKRQQSKLLQTLSRADVTPVGEPFSLGYDAPGTPPFLRRNEVAIEVTWEPT